MFRAVCFLLRLDKTHYGELLEDLNKGAYRGGDDYPETVIGAYELLTINSRQIGISTSQ